MNVDYILETFNAHQVAYLLIGGMNFLLRHAPVLTFDVDLWIEDTPENLRRCELALGKLRAEWGTSNQDWAPVASRAPGWLSHQMVFCLTSLFGPIDVFRSVKGLESWEVCRSRVQQSTAASGIPYAALSDEDMLRCQMSLPEPERNQQRIRALRKALGQAEHE